MLRRTELLGIGESLSRPSVATLAKAPNFPGLISLLRSEVSDSERVTASSTPPFSNLDHIWRQSEAEVADPAKPVTFEALLACSDLGLPTLTPVT